MTRLRLLDTRRAGVLAHPTSLRAGSAQGDFGPAVIRFLDWAHRGGFGVWQVLPLTPAGPGGSPYSALSSFAGDTELISLDRLATEGWLDPTDIRERPADSQPILRRAWLRFRARAEASSRREFESFVEDLGTRGWLDDWAAFHAIRVRMRNLPWSEWDRELARRDTAALRAVFRDLADEIEFERWLQFVFTRQWSCVRQEAHARGIAILGDLPFYPADDSADVWSRPELFSLDPAGRPRRVAGVPPDYFSSTGQLWGHPTFDWQAMSDEGFAWSTARLAGHLARFDALRLDHFRGYEAFWEVDAGSATAAQGHWMAGPGRAPFDAARAQLGELPCVAEDLGEISERVRSLRSSLGFPGMRVLQFGFSAGQDEHRIDRLEPDCVAYTGTHDNDTTRGWFDSLAPAERQRILHEIGGTDEEIVPRLIELLWGSPARVVVAPLQDLLDLGTDARMNRPGVVDGNWGWGIPVDDLVGATAERFASLAAAASR